MSGKDFAIEYAFIEETKAKYESQLNALWDAGMKGDKVFIKMLAVGQKLGQPFVMYLANVYTRHLLHRRIHHDGVVLDTAELAQQGVGSL